MPTRKVLPKATGEDAEGLARVPKATGDDTEGHLARVPKATGEDAEGLARVPKATGDDTEGHLARVPKATGEDAEGYGQERMHRQPPDDPRGPKATGDEDDTEGQFMLPNPEINRHLARAREAEIQRNLQQREKTLEARRPHNKRGRA
jgi:hypothetical protein